MAILKGLVKVLRKIFVGDKPSPRRRHKDHRPTKNARRSKVPKRGKRTRTARPRVKRVLRKKKINKASARVAASSTRLSVTLRKKSGLKKAGHPGTSKAAKLAAEVQAGEVTHYFSKISVVVLKVTGGSLKVGERIHIKGAVTDFVQSISSMQVESVDVKQARKGQLIGLKVMQVARPGDGVYKVNA